MKFSKTMMILFFLLSVLFVKAQDQMIAKNETPAFRYAAVNNAAEKQFSVTPAAVKKSARIIIEAENDAWAMVQVKDQTGEVVLEQEMAVTKGSNNVPLFFVSKLERGIYNIELTIEEKVSFSKMVKE